MTQSRTPSDKFVSRFEVRVGYIHSLDKILLKSLFLNFFISSWFYIHEVLLLAALQIAFIFPSPVIGLDGPLCCPLSISSSMLIANKIFFHTSTGLFEKLTAKTCRDTNTRIFVTPIGILKFSFARFSSFDATTRTQASVNSRIKTDDSDLSGVTDCRPALILYWSGIFIIVKMSLVTAALVAFLFIRPDEVM